MPEDLGNSDDEFEEVSNFRGMRRDSVVILFYSGRRNPRAAVPRARLRPCRN